MLINTFCGLLIIISLLNVAHIEKKKKKITNTVSNTDNPRYLENSLTHHQTVTKHANA